MCYIDWLEEGSGCLNMKKKLRCLTKREVFYVLVLVVCVFITLQLHNIISFFTKVHSVDKAAFIPVNKLNVLTFHNVCIEVARHPVTRTLQFKSSERAYNETKQIVIYNHVATSDAISRLSVSGSSNTIWNHWDVFYNSSGIPENYTYYKDKAVFFVAPTCPGNLHHFWEDEFRVLQSVVSATNRLNSANKNQILYRVPWDLEPDDLDCYNVKTFEKLLMLLNFEPFHDVFYKMPANVCFEHAVFGLADFSGSKRDASNYVLKKLGIDYSSCPKDHVTIIQRKYRRILNMQALVNITKIEGFQNVSVVQLEDLSMREQIQAVACSTVLVGVQGAGLQWAVLMRPGSTLIEIAWPKQYWKYYFNGFIPPYNIYHRGVLANHLRVNWAAYQDKVRQGREVPPEERKELLVSPPKSPDLDNIWKWADPIVEEKHYMFALRSHKYAYMIRNHR